jgi:Ca2+-binding EF-hand superfamily protein
MQALLAAQGQSSATTTSAPTSRSAALQDLFSQIDANGNGQITKSEFENALGAGGTNTAAADSVFNQLDSNGDGSVSLGELSAALKGSGGRHGHHHVASGSSGTASTDPSADPLLQALQASSSTSSASSGTLSSASLTPADLSSVKSISLGSKAAWSYNSLDQMMQRQGQMMSLAA